MYLTGAPILRISDNQSDEGIVRELKQHSLVTSDERDSLFKLIITFITPDGKVLMQLRFYEIII